MQSGVEVRLGTIGDLRLKLAIASASSRWRAPMREAAPTST
jgi:hypothetical protein